MMRIEISLRDVFAAQRAQALKALLLLACGLVAAGLIVWRSARRPGAPITSLADAARRLTRGEMRSEERRGGNVCISTSRSRWWPYHSKHNQRHQSFEIR